MSGISFNPDAGDNGSYKLTPNLSGDGLKLTKPNFDMAEAVKKLKPAKSSEVTNGQRVAWVISNETSITDKDGNLKPGVDPKNVLNEDGTLKPGWSVDKNGVPKYSKIQAKFEELAKMEKKLHPVPKQDIEFIKDPGFYLPEPDVHDLRFKILPNIIKPDVRPIKMPDLGFKGDPGFYLPEPDVHDPGFIKEPDVYDPGFKGVPNKIKTGSSERPRYEVKDGKLVALPKPELKLPDLNLKEMG